MASSRTSRSPPIGVKVICGVEGIGAVLTGILLTEVAVPTVFTGPPSAVVLSVLSYAALTVFLVALYGLWKMASWGWWGVVLAHLLSIVFSSWFILVSLNRIRPVVRLALAVLITGYLYTKRELYL